MYIFVVSHSIHDTVATRGPISRWVWRLLFPPLPTRLGSEPPVVSTSVVNVLTLLRVWIKTSGHIQSWDLSLLTSFHPCGTIPQTWNRIFVILRKPTEILLLLPYIKQKKFLLWNDRYISYPTVIHSILRLVVWQMSYNIFRSTFYSWDLLVIEPQLLFLYLVSV